MALYKIKEYYPDYREHFGDHDVLGYDLYSGNDKVGSIDNLLVDDDGRFRYLIINTGAWIFGKKVLLPIGRARINYTDHRVYVDGLSREQVENLPEYDGSAPVDFDYEEQVRGVYRGGTSDVGMGTGYAGTSATNTTPIETNTPLDTPVGLTDADMTRRNVDREVTPVGRRDVVDTPMSYSRDNYRYENDRHLFDMNDQDHQNLRLYEERLIANKQRQKTGEVIVGKHVETETAHVSVPVERERVIIERTTPTDAGVVATPGEGAFREGEVARMEVYEEVPDIRKETVVREEVNVRKEVTQETVDANDTIRRERLDINREGNPVVDGSDQLPNV
ncbi:MAG TPA: DUF2382 domain-containing protein [Trichocoleus sp.]|jgi:uncharacterized protein (TIGR02271 family)